VWSPICIRARSGSKLVSQATSGATDGSRAFENRSTARGVLPEPNWNSVVRASGRWKSVAAYTDCFEKRNIGRDVQAMASNPSVETGRAYAHRYEVLGTEPKAIPGRCERERPFNIRNR